PPTQLTLHLTGPGLAPDGTSTTQVTAIARDAAGNIAYDAVGTVTFTSANPAAVSVVTPTVPLAGGMAVATLQAGTVAQPAVITAATPGLAPSTVTITPEAGVLLIADPNPLAADPSARGTLVVRLAGVTGPLTIELTSSNPGVVRFEYGRMTTVTVTADEAQVTLIGSYMAGTATISGRVLGDPASTVIIHSAEIRTAMVGAPYQLSIDAVQPAQAGTAQQAVIRVRDVMGTQVAGAYPLTDVVLERVSADGTVEQLGTATTQYGKAVIPFTTPVAGTYTLRVTGRVQGMWDLIGAETTYSVY
ncbi:MAG TPA: hypothetical protein VNT75_02075, partial [Symbiobacteriaceae bacterium]|nr:hypothetical protein [Symbiobacteriaceae bacterium]